MSDRRENNAGDTFIYDSGKNHTNTAEELTAAKRFFGLLPKEQAEKFIGIWTELKRVLQTRQGSQKQWISLLAPICNRCVSKTENNAEEFVFVAQIANLRQRVEVCR